jgi:hypothetical protein
MSGRKTRNQPMMRALGPIMRGHIRTNYKNTTGVKLSVGGTDTDNA